MNIKLRKLVWQMALAGCSATLSTSVLAKPGVQIPPPGPGEVPDYFGVVPNYATSPQPLLTKVIITDQAGGGATASAGVDADGSSTGTAGAVTGITVNDPGLHYANPQVTITDGADGSGPGTGASATASVDPATGAITAISVSSPGTGYTQPFVTITDGGQHGSGAIAAAATWDYVNDVATDGVTDVQLVDQGNGQPGGQNYSAWTTVTIEGGPGVTSPAQVVPTIEGGVITGFTINSPGAGYRQAPIAGSGIRKFVDSMPVLDPDGTHLNNLGQSLRIATPTVVTEHNADGSVKLQADGVTPVTSDYYIIGEREYKQKLHSDLPATTLRGYVQLDATGNPIGPVQYLGPIIVAHKDRAVRIKLVNQLPTGQGGNLPIPVDRTYMGASDTDNRTAMHLHGGNTPWISDGTPHQWIKPAGEAGAPRGESARDVPDMWFDGSGNLQEGCTGAATCPGGKNFPGNGALTFYYTNQQSARLMFYHDHAEGTTRLNVYAGMAGAYVLQDPTEQKLVAEGLLPPLEDTIPLVIQEKTFVPDNTTPVMNFYGAFASQLNSQDPTWRWGTGTAAPGLTGNGDLWVPHVFMTNQNPGDASGANAVGRWDYGPWFWPPFVGIQNGPVNNPYYDPNCTSSNPDAKTGACEGQTIPGVPNGAINAYGPNDPKSQPSGTPEAFNDTSTVNGTVYPHIEVQPKKYRLRFLSVGNDRHLNLSLVVAASNDPAHPTTAENSSGAIICDGNSGHSDTGKGESYPNGKVPECTEVKMVPFNAAQDQTSKFPSHWYTKQKGGVSFDGRPGGVFDPATRGPAMVQIGTEGGFLSTPAVIRNQPVNYEYNVKNIVVGNIKEHALLLGPAERADVVVDFSKFAGSTVILYNDAPAATPAADLRLDYYTGNADNTDTGGAFSTLPGYGPNTRTLMQFRVSACGGEAGCTTFDPAASADYVDPAYVSVDASGATIGGKLTNAVRLAFKESQEPIIVPQAAYNSVYGTAVADALGAQLSRISDHELTYQPLALDPDTDIPTGALEAPVTLTMQPKSIIEDWTIDFGRMNAMLGVEMPHTTAINQTSLPQGYIDPMTELVKVSKIGQPISGMMADGSQLWKITHNGVDTHPVHFHLFHVQIVNRVGWDGAVTGPAPNELGWKDTVRMNPLEDVIVALRPRTMELPFKLGNSRRVPDPTNPGTQANEAMSFNFSPVSGLNSNVSNIPLNYGWEYVWHCHILGHEENDFMRPIAMARAPEVPTLTAATGGGNVALAWTDNSVVANWIEIQRSTTPSFSPATTTSFNVVVPECSNQLGCARTFSDNGAPQQTLYYRIRANNTVGGGNGKLEGGYDPNTGAYLETLPPELASLTPQFIGYSNVTASSDWSSTAVRESSPKASVTPASLSFPNTNVGSTSGTSNQTRRTVTIANTGTAVLHVAGITFTGPFGSAGGSCNSNGAFNLNPGQNCTVNVSFKPDSTCPSSAATTVACTGLMTVTNDSNNVMGSTQTAQLSGTGAWTTPSTPTGLGAAGKTQTALTLTWANAGSAKTYRVQRATNATFTQNLVTVQDVTTNSLAVTGLAVNTPYYFRVASVNPAGTSANSGAFNTSTLPNVPGTPIVSNVTGGSVTLNWTASAAPNAGVTYSVQRATDAGFTTNVATTSNINALSTNVTGLNGSTTYYFRILANNAGNTGASGAASDSASATTTVAAIPAAPTGVTAANGALLPLRLITAGLNWTASAGATGYNVRYSDVSSMAGARTVTAVASGTQINVGGRARTVYMQVQAVYAGGTTAWSPASPTAVSAR